MSNRCDFDSMPKQLDCIVKEGDKMMISPASIQSYIPLACTTSDRTTGTIAVKTFRVTISPKGDVSDLLVKWIKKTYEDNNKYVVIEKGTSGQRHLHMLIQFEKPKQKKDLRDVLSRIIKKYHEDSILKFALVINSCYDMNWYDEYLRKEQDVEHVCTDDFDADVFRNALPDQATQDALQAATGRRPIGSFWIDHEKRWIEYSPDVSTHESASKYFEYRMFVIRDMEPISGRRLLEITYTLFKYRNRSHGYDMAQRQYFEKHFEGQIQSFSRI